MSTSIPTVIVTQNMMRNAARGCVRSMEIMTKEHPHELSFWHIPYYILAATALELFAKLILIRRWEKETDALVIEKNLKALGHDLESIYSDEFLGRDVRKAANILKVEKKEDKDLFIYRYDFHSENRQSVQVYDAESLKYGLMAGFRSNAAVVAYQFDDLLALCTRMEQVARTHV